MKRTRSLFRSLFTLGLLLPFAAGAQDFDHYKPLKCSGEIPEDFRKLSRDKFKDDLKEEAKTAKNHYVSKTKEEFLLKSNYLIDDLLLSGKVLFNDLVTAHVNKVADKLLINDPELRGKLSFYCIKSTQANAFSTDQGIVFVTLGLVAQLENEAQLAFVLSHEIAHYEKRHTINSYIENERIFSRRGENRYSTFEDRIKLASSYSKDLEFEADSLGLARLRSSAYDANQALSSMMVLQYSYLPFDEVKFDASFLENDVMKLPKSLYLDTLKPINFESDNEDDDRSSHPNIRKRRTRMETALASRPGEGTLLFAAGDKNEFARILKLARFEMVRLHLNNREYCDALYNARALQKEEPKSKYLEVAVGKALYGMAKYKNDGHISKVYNDYEEYEGNLQQVYHWFYKIEPAQLNTITLRYFYDLQKKYDDAFIRNMMNDLALASIEEHEVNYNELQKGIAAYVEKKKAEEAALNPKPADTVKVKEPEEANPEGVSKYEKIRKLQKTEETKKIVSEDVSESKFYLLAFSDIMGDPGVQAMFDRAQAKADERKAKKEESKKSRGTSSYERRKAAAEKKKATQAGALGIDSIVVVDPFYFAVDERKGLKLMDSESGLLEFIAQIKENAAMAGLNVVLIAPKAFSAADVEAYNDMAAMNDWMGERTAHDNDMEFVPLESDHVAYLVKKYGTKHFAYTGIVTVKEKKEGVFGIIVLGIVLYPLLPAAIVYAAMPAHNTDYYTLLFNIETGEPVLTENVELRAKSKKGFINSLMYDQMKQIKKEAKTEKK